MVPMFSHIRRGIRVVEFADLGVSDNNAPILACDAAMDAATARATSAALVDGLRALPDRFDLLRLKKMPAYVGAKPKIETFELANARHTNTPATTVMMRSGPVPTVAREWNDMNAKIPASTSSLFVGRAK